MSDVWNWVQATFTNREIATGIWLLGALTCCLFLRDIPNQLWGVLKTALAGKLVILFGTLAVNITGLCWVMSFLGLWDHDQLASTVLWFFLSGLALTGRTVTAKENKGYFKKVFLDNFKVAGVFEFLVVAYSFSLPVELVIVPSMAFFGLMIGFTGSKEEYASVKKIFEYLVLIIVLALLSKSVGSIWKQPGAFFTTQTGRNFVLPGLLTAGSIPFLYVWYCYAQFERACIQINFKTFQSDELKRYAKRRFFFTFIARPWLLRCAISQFHAKPARTKRDVDLIIAGILTS